MNEFTNNNIVFYQLTETLIAAIGAILLLAIWKNIRGRFSQKLEEDDTQKRIDKGLLYLGLAILIWMFKGIFMLIAKELDPIVLQAVTVFFSLFNSLFFILALFYFDHAPKFLYQNDKNVKRIFLVFLSISILSFIIFLKYDLNTTNGFHLSAIPDIIISGILSYLLIYAFYKTFRERKLKFIAYFSLVTLLLMFLAQLPEVITSVDANSWQVDLIRIISKSALISLCLVLATTWVIELADTPAPSEMAISFIDWSLIEISIPSKGINKQKIDFKGKHTQFRNLLKFAIRRKYAPVSDHCIEIVRSGEIQGQVYLSRIMDDINSSLLNASAERKDIFTFIGLGKYRIRFIPENIKIDSALLHEFVHENENEVYAMFMKGDRNP